MAAHLETELHVGFSGESKPRKGIWIEPIRSFLEISFSSEGANGTESRRSVPSSKLSLEPANRKGIGRKCDI